MAPRLSRLLVAMAAGAAVSGVLGYFFGSMPPHSYYHLILMNPAVRARIPAIMERRFIADLWIHSASYAVGISGGLICCVLMVRRRGRLARQDGNPEHLAQDFA